MTDNPCPTRVRLSLILKAPVCLCQDTLSKSIGGMVLKEAGDGGKVPCNIRKGCDGLVSPIIGSCARPRWTKSPIPLQTLSVCTAGQDF